MAQYAFEHEREQAESMVTAVANPIPLGMGVLAFTTAILGCFYAGFIIPSFGPTIRIAVSAALFYGGIVQVLAGMWEFKKANTLAATIFSSYGGFLVALGAIFIPAFGLLGAIFATGIYRAALGLFFLCWTIFTGILFLGALRTNMALLLVLLLLFVGYLFLTIGQLAGGTPVVLTIGGWLIIVCALVAWYTALAELLESTGSAFRLPTGLISHEHRQLGHA